MARKPFVLRVDERLLAELKRWADDELRSLNAQIEWLLRDAVARRSRAAGERLPPVAPSTDETNE